MQDSIKQLNRLLEAAADSTRPPLIMGVLNVTPDSFADGGRYNDPDAAIAHGLTMAEAGADIIDVGGESTRPGATPVSPEEELRRILPVIRGLAKRVPALSVDTRHAEVAEAALDAGAIIVNDVSAFQYDPEMPYLLARRKPGAVAMHMRGVPADMAMRTEYRSLIADCASELWNAAIKAVEAGLPMENLWLDPGIGFAKNATQSLSLLADLDVFVRLGRPLVVGVSRKSFIGHILGGKGPAERLFGTAGAVAAAVLKGARVIRVHDVAEMRDVAIVAHAIARAKAGGI